MSYIYAFDYLAMIHVHSCTLWLLYGYEKSNGTIVIVNFIGAALQLLYALVYLRYTSDKVNRSLKKRRKKKEQSIEFDSIVLFNIDYRSHRMYDFYHRLFSFLQ
jgi:hypothetical protein